MKQTEAHTLMCSETMVTAEVFLFSGLLFTASRCFVVNHVRTKTRSHGERERID